MMTNKSPFEELADQLKRIIVNKPFYGVFLSYLNKTILFKNDPMYKVIHTAAVSPRKDMVGFKLLINWDFWKNSLRAHAKTEKDERVKVLLHEALHIIFHHIMLSDNFKYKKLFNIAADLEVNQYCGDIGDGHDMSLEEYRKFIEDNKEKIMSGEIVAPMRSVKLEDYDFDPKTESSMGTTYYYEKLLEKRDEDSELGEMIRNICDIQDVVDMFGHGEWESISDLTEAAKDMYKSQVDFQLKEAEKTVSRGHVPGFVRQLIEERTQPPTINWKDVFRRFMNSSIDYYMRTSRSKYNKRLPHMPGLKIRNKHKILVAVDTSGSMSNKDLEECFSEVTHMWRSGVSVDVIECDAAFDEEKDLYKYEGKIPKERKGLSGGGGTSFDDPIEYYMNNDYSCMIYLTDGFAPAPTTYGRKKPLMWLLTSSGDSIESLKKQGFPGVILKMIHKN